MTDGKDPASKLYELSQDPNFSGIWETLTAIASDWYAPMPRKDEDKVAYETSNSVSNTIRLITQTIQNEIEVGRRLSLTAEQQGESDDAESRFVRARRRV